MRKIGRMVRNSQIVVLHISHPPRRVPADESHASVSMTRRRMTDAFTDELFPVTPVDAGRMTSPSHADCWSGSELKTSHVSFGLHWQ